MHWEVYRVKRKRRHVPFAVCTLALWVVTCVRVEVRYLAFLHWECE